jgi:sec-independent protein translocase protein TatC
MSKKDKKKDENLAEGTLISHLLELRDRLVKAVAGVFLLFVPAIIFRKQIFALLVDPLVRSLKDGDKLMAFVAPGLYRKEKRFAVPLLVSSIVLFYMGIAFAYFAMFPVAFGFFSNQDLMGVGYSPDINAVLDFVLATFFAFGVAFEVPVVVVLLAVTGLVSVQKLAEARGYVVIGVFVAAAVLTPPDPISQIMMAIPMWLLFEGGLVMARVLRAGAKEAENASA